MRCEYRNNYFGKGSSIALAEFVYFTHHLLANAKEKSQKGALLHEGSVLLSTFEFWF
jgi:hypothetical protein